MARRKYKEYYYSTKVTGFKERNNTAPIKLYSWFIRNKEGQVLQASEQEFERKEDAVFDAEEHIDEHYY